MTADDGIVYDLTRARLADGQETTVYLDDPEAGQLWEALRSGAVSSYAEQHANDALGPVTR